MLPWAWADLGIIAGRVARASAAARCHASCMSDEQWFYCLKHHTVEGADGCRAADRLGPYPV